MNEERLVRSGVVSRVINGCASVRVSVPCSSCRHGVCAGTRNSGAIMELRDVSLGIGDEVAISVSRIALTRVAVCLFGPLIVWALCLAAMPASDPVVLTAVGVVGLAVSLWLGQRLGSARLADLDVRLGPGDRADGNMGIVSGS